MTRGSCVPTFVKVSGLDICKERLGCTVTLTATKPGVFNQTAGRFLQYVVGTCWFFL